MQDTLETEVQRIGRELIAGLPGAVRHPLRAADERALELASADGDLRAALLRFVDVAPACRTVDDLAGHLNSLLGELDHPPPPLRAAMRATHTRAGRAGLGRAAAAGVRHMSHRFIAAERPSRVVGLAGRLWRRGVAVSVDLLGEATVSAGEADGYAARCADALEELSAAAASWPSHPALGSDSAGAVPAANLSVKVSALTPLLRPEAPELGREDAAGRLGELLERAHRLGAHLHVDSESFDSLEVVHELVLDLLGEARFAAGPSAGIVLQAYLRDSGEQLDRVLDWARECSRGSPLTVRLVKGAYWDHEVIEARQHGWSAPVFEDKAECDRNFEALTRRLLDARPAVRVAVASHNVRSVAHAIAYNRLTGGDDRDLELQVLRGLGDDLQDALAARGLRVRTYCPVGDLVAGMAYLVRRLLENTANESFLHEHARGADPAELLAAP